MATTIKLKNSVTTTAAPSTLVQGEAAVNITDKKVWVGDASSSPVQIIGAGAPVSGTTGTFTGNVSVAGTFSANGGATLGDASGDALTINSSAVSIPNGLNFDSNTFVIDATNNRVGVGTASPSASIHGVGATSSYVARLDAANTSGTYYLAELRASTTAVGAITSDATNLALNSITGATLFYTTNTERMRIDSSGNLGLGVTPSAWGAPLKGFDIGAVGGLAAGTTSADGVTLARNGFWNGSSWIYKNTSAASHYEQTGGQHRWYTAPSGTAGTAITFTQAMTLDSSGRLGIGTSSPARKLDISDSTTDVAKITTSSVSDSILLSLQGGSGVRQRFLPLGGSGNYNWQVAASTNVSNAFEITPSTASGGSTFSTPAFLIAGATGNVGIGTGGNPSVKLDVRTASGTNCYQYLYGGGASDLARLYFLNGTSNVYIGNTAAGNVLDFNSKMTLDSSGNLGLGVTPSASTAGSYKGLYVGIGMLKGAAVNSTSQFSSNLDLADKYLVSAAATSYTQGSGIHAWFNAASGTAGTTATLTQAMTLDASGNLGVGTTSSLKGVTSALSTATNYQFTARDTRSMAANVGGGIAFEGNDGTLSDRAFGVIIGAKENATSGNYDGYLAFYSRTNGSSPAERMRIDSSGNLLVGGTTSGNRLTVTGSGSSDVSVFVSPGAPTGVKFARFTVGAGLGTEVGSVSYNGSTGVNYNTSSDYRLKDITGNLTGYKERIMALQPKQGTWKADGSVFKGFLAHEFAEQYPNAVSGEKDAVNEDGSIKPQGMQAGGSETIADLVALVKELVTEVDSLKAQLNK